MKVSEKALALALSITMVISSFTGTSVFAADNANTGEQVYDSNVSATNDAESLVLNSKHHFIVTGHENEALTWSVANGSDGKPLESGDGVVSIDVNGIVTATDFGRAVLQAADSSNNVVSYVKVEVSTHSYRDISINQNNYLALNSTYTATFIDSDQSTGGVTWESADNSVATIDANSGVIKALKVGCTQIIAKFQDGSMSRDVYVYDPGKAQLFYSNDEQNFNNQNQISEQPGQISGNSNDFFGTPLSKDIYDGIGDYWYIEVPCKDSDYHYESYIRGEQSGATNAMIQSIKPVNIVETRTSADNQSTILKISKKDLDASLSDLVISAEPRKSGILHYSWDIPYNGPSINQKELNVGNAGTYTSQDGKTFTLSKDGKFYWGTANKEVKNKASITDKYNFTYNNSLYYTIESNGDNSSVCSISAQIPRDNSTGSWVYDGCESDFYNLNWNENSNSPVFTDQLGVIYYLNGSAPVQPSNGSSVTGSSSASTSTDTPSTTNVTKDTSGASSVTVTGVPDSAPTVSGGSSSFGITVPSNTVQAAEAGANAKNHGKAVIDLPDSTILDQFNDDSVKSVSITLKAPSDIAYGTADNVDVTIKLSAQALQAARQAKKDITTTVVDAATGTAAYSWTFKGADLDLIKDLNLAMNTKTSTLDPAVRSLSSVPGVLLTMANNSNLPGSATVRVYVGDQGFKAGQMAYLYYCNTAEKQLEYSDCHFCKVDADGYVSININHCSKYVLLPQRVKAVPAMKLDTGKRLSVKAGKAYTFKVTASKKPTFVSGNSSVFQAKFAGSKGSDYFFTVTAVGKAGGSAGFYVSGETSPRTVGTIVK
ncbi:MAG TPA: Ig-like domain-containing protein [Caproicibacter sp.]|nr:Ig-like domain-containing protein [Caproicibacter sp.]